MCRALVTIISVAPFAGVPVKALDSAAEFYRGKQITVVVGSSAGGGYDIYARLLARHMPKHIPGNPGMTVSNMAGARSNTQGPPHHHLAAQDRPHLRGPHQQARLQCPLHAPLRDAPLPPP